MLNVFILLSNTALCALCWLITDYSLNHTMGCPVTMGALELYFSYVLALGIAPNCCFYLMLSRVDNV